MKIVKVYVSSFGKLKDFTYDFSAELNTIKQNNGWGKTTLATFIKAMFYGLDGGAKRSISENERKRFKPWNSTETFGGFVQFTWGENEYKLERYFGNKEAEDTVTLTDVKTGKTFSNTDNLGKRIFEIDAEGFSLTTYFAQKDLESKSNTSLTEKFNSVCDIDNTDSFDKALQNVTAKAKEFKYTGDRGLIPDAKREIYALNEQIEKTSRAELTAKTLKEEASVLESEVKRLVLETDNLTAQIKVAGKLEANALKKERYEKLVAQKRRLNDDIVVADKTLNGVEVTKEKIANCQRNVIALENLKSNYKTLATEFETLKNPATQPSKKTNSSLFLILMVLTALFVVGGGVCLAVLGAKNLLPWVFVGIGGILGCVGLLLKVSQKKSIKEQVDPYQILIDEKLSKIKSLEENIVNLEREIFAFISAFSVNESLSITDRLTEIEKQLQIKSIASQNLENINNELADLVANGNDFLLTESEGVNLNELNKRLKIVQAEYSQKSNELANKKSLVISYENLASNYTELEEKKADILEKIVGYEDQLDTLNLVAKYLKIADENLKVRYRAPLQNSLNKYVSLLTDGKYSVNIDIDLNVTVNEKVGDKDTDFYSKGYQNLFEICKRFALIDVLFTGEKPFIIIDDSFYNLDEEKLSIALNLLKDLAKEYQIIYLVCHNSREVK